LKPYVAYSTPRIPEEKYEDRIIEIDEGLMKRIDKQISDSPNKKMLTDGKTDPLSAIYGKKS
jgi:hypothetical protein